MAGAIRHKGDLLTIGRIAGTQAIQVFGGKAVLGQRAGAIAVDEDVGFADQGRQIGAAFFGFGSAAAAGAVLPVGAVALLVVVVVGVFSVLVAMILFLGS